MSRCAIRQRTQFSGRHVGRPDGFAPTGRRCRVQHVHMYRVTDGLLSEHWACRDDLGAARQLITTTRPPHRDDARRRGTFDRLRSPRMHLTMHEQPIEPHARTRCPRPGHDALCAAAAELTLATALPQPITPSALTPASAMSTPHRRGAEWHERTSRLRHPAGMATTTLNDGQLPSILAAFDLGSWGRLSSGPVASGRLGSIFRIRRCRPGRSVPGARPDPRRVRHGGAAAGGSHPRCVRRGGRTRARREPTRLRDADRADLSHRRRGPIDRPAVNRTGDTVLRWASDGGATVALGSWR